MTFYLCIWAWIVGLALNVDRGGNANHVDIYAYVANSLYMIIAYQSLGRHWQIIDILKHFFPIWLYPHRHLAYKLQGQCYRTMYCGEARMDRFVYVHGWWVSCCGICIAVKMLTLTLYVWWWFVNGKEHDLKMPYVRAAFQYNIYSTV